MSPYSVPFTGLSTPSELAPSRFFFGIKFRACVVSSIRWIVEN